jgi:hypothetical protein
MNAKNQKNQAQLRAALQLNAVQRASELRAPLGISQPTLSRLLADMGSQLAVLGKGPRTRYGLHRDVRGLGASWPIFQISESGISVKLGVLHALHQGAFWFDAQIQCDWLTGEFQDGLFPDFPWFLYDLRPQGFLGRALARRVASALLCDPDPRNWSADLVLHAFLAFGSDLSGNLVIGDAALETALNFTPSMQSIAAFPELAERALAGEWMGSSAAGEQPKFSCWMPNNEGEITAHLVKFSPPMDSISGQRWADLLAAESIADALLGGTSSTVDAANRRFLVAERFDRIGPRGRRGFISIGAADAAYFGGFDNWASCANRFEQAGWLSESDADTLRMRYFFGKAIGNTDMHFGNASLIFSTSQPMALAPSYDMLPMQFAPLANGEVLTRSFSMPAQRGNAVQARAHALASQFWQRVADDARISAEFSGIARDLA